MLIAALFVGVVIGVVATLLLRRREPEDRAAVKAPPVAAPVEHSPELELGRLVQRAVDRLELSVIVFDADGRAQFRNETARQLSGTHVGVLIDSAIDEIRSTARSAGVGERRIDLHGPPKSALLLVAQEIGEGAVVVVIDDVSERERIANMRTDFVANISHELKTPVGAISVLADALLDEDDLAVVARVAGRIVDESARAVTAIDDLLELSRIESAPVDDDVVGLHEIVEAALARGRTVEGHQGVQLSSFDAGRPIWIRGDRRQLTSAVGNLVENAVKYSDADGAVQVRTRVDDRWIEIMVADQGVGIPARDLARIFERFYRVDRARSRSTGGTGLGLSIVRRVATNHGGDVQVSSTEGEGSTFVLRLPAALETAAPGVGSVGMSGAAEPASKGESVVAGVGPSRIDEGGVDDGLTEEIGSDQAMSEGT